MPTRPPTKEEADKIGAAARDRQTSENHIDTHFLAMANRSVPELMKASSKALDELFNELKAKQAEKAKEILKKLGMNGTLLPASAKYGDLPKDLRDKLMSQIGNDWQAYGFASKLDAESFLLNSDSMQLSTSVGLMHCQRPGDPSTNTPGSYGSFMFAHLGGGIGP